MKPLGVVSPWLRGTAAMNPKSHTWYAEFVGGRPFGCVSSADQVNSTNFPFGILRDTQIVQLGNKEKTVIWRREGLVHLPTPATTFPSPTIHPGICPARQATKGKGWQAKTAAGQNANDRRSQMDGFRHQDANVGVQAAGLEISDLAAYIWAHELATSRSKFATSLMKICFFGGP